MNSTWLMIGGMALVTYLPRLLPFLMVSGKKLPRKFELFLGYIPYAALGALIIPGFLTAIPGHSLVAAAGLLAALLLSFVKEGVVVPVIGAIGCCFLLLQIGI